MTAAGAGDALGTLAIALVVRPRPGGLSGEHMADDPPARPRFWPGSLRRRGLDLRPFCVGAGRVRGRSRRGRLNHADRLQGPGLA